MGKNKILYISDSLGTPVPHRGIFNFSVGFIEKLKNDGNDVVLLVERPEGQGVRKHWLESGENLEKSMHAWQNSELYKYLNSGRFEFSLEINEHIDFAARDAASYSVRKFLEEHKAEHIETIIRNIDSDFFLVQDSPIESEAKRLRKAARIDFLAQYFDNSGNPFYSEATDIQEDLITETNKYLQLFSGFLSINRVYSNALMRAHNFIPPMPVDCSGFDQVIIDGPHYLALKNNDPSATSQIIYDLIPLKNSSLSEVSHRSFSQKLFASLKHDANIIFISEAAQKEFHETFPERVFRSERIVYPTVRNVLQQADRSSAAARDFLRNIAVQKKIEKNQNSSRPRRLLDVTGKLRAVLRSLAKSNRNWNSELPFFVTVLSDEPYKNASVCIKAFNDLRNSANLIVVGRMDAQKYTGGEYSENIYFAGFLFDEVKNDLISRSAGLIFPSFYEGFGLPVLEGALQGVPVLCSAIEVFYEIVDEHALFFDPHDHNELRMRILDILSDPRSAKDRAVAAEMFVRKKFMR